MTESSEETRSQGGDNNPTMDITTIVPINPGYADQTCTSPRQHDLALLQAEQDFIKRHQQLGSSPGILLIMRDFFRGFRPPHGIMEVQN